MATNTLIKYDEPQLVEQLKQGSREGFSYLYDHYSQALYGIVCKVIQDEEIAKDVLQEVFVKIWKNVNAYDESKGRLFTWMLNIARNQAIDKARSKGFQNTQKNQSIEDSVNVVDQQNTISLNPEIIGVRQLVNVLKKEQKELIDLVYFNGYTQEEAAKKLNIPTGTVKTRIRAALMLLRTTYKSQN
jgi:RNA polymerase sigma-70 factor (ECF subfamily)